MKRFTSPLLRIWGKKYKLAIFVITAVLCTLILSIELISMGRYDLKVAEKLNDVALVATAGMLFWYSRETADLKDISIKSIKELRKQVFLQQRPFIRLQWLTQEFFGIRIINEGEGTAINLTIEAAGKPVIKRSIVAAERAMKSFTDAGFEDAGQAKDYDFKVTFSPTQQYDLAVNYYDIAGNKYCQKYKTNDSLNDKFELIEWDLPVDFEKLLLKKVTI